MSEIPAIASALKSLAAATGIAKNLKGQDRPVGDAQVKLWTAELMELLVDARSKMLDIKEENLALRERNSQIESQLQSRLRMTFAGGVYWTDFETPQRSGPFCQKCFDSDQKCVRLQEHYTEQVDGSRALLWHCTVCTTDYSREG